MANEAASSDELATGAGFGLGPREIAAILLRHVRLIAAFALIGLAVAAIIAASLANRYEASAIVQIDPRAKRIINIEGVLADLKIDNPTIESEVEIIRSKSIALRVIDRLGLRNSPELTAPGTLQVLLTRLGLSQPSRSPAPAKADEKAPKGSAGWSFGLNHLTTAGAPERDSVALEFESRLKVFRIRNSQLIEIRFGARDPVLAARIANAIATAYISAQIESKQKATAAASSLLDERLQTMRTKVAAADRALQQFKVDNGMFDADGRPIDDTQLQREMDLMLQARSRTADARAKFEQARRMMLNGESQDTLSDVMQSGVIRQLREELGQAQRREAELSTRYGPRHPEMLKVTAELAKAQAAMTTEVNKIIRSLRTELQLATERERDQQSRFGDIKARITVSKDKQWRLRELERDAFASKQLYEAILSRSKQTQETVALQVPDARIVADADVPLSPSSPRRKIIALVGLVLGLGLGVGLAFLLELGTDGIRRPEEIEPKLQTRHLASLPLLRQTGDALHMLRLTLSTPSSPFAESIANLRHGLDSGQGIDRPRVILVTSSGTGDGKSVVASNLAMHYAMTGRRTLLVDADLRRRALSRDLGLADRPGISDVLSGAAPPATAIVCDQSCGLYVLGAGGHALDDARAAGMLTGARPASLLDWLRGSFDIVVVDSPPLMPVVDARLLASNADQILLVAGWRSTPVSSLKRSVELLGADSSRLAGVVPNRMDPDIHREIIGSYNADHRTAASLELPRARAA